MKVRRPKSDVRKKPEERNPNRRHSRLSVAGFFRASDFWKSELRS